MAWEGGASKEWFGSENKRGRHDHMLTTTKRITRINWEFSERYYILSRPLLILEYIIEDGHTSIVTKFISDRLPTLYPFLFVESSSSFLFFLFRRVFFPLLLHWILLFITFFHSNHPTDVMLVLINTTWTAAKLSFIMSALSTALIRLDLRWCRRKDFNQSSIRHSPQADREYRSESTNKTKSWAHGIDEVQNYNGRHR